MSLVVMSIKNVAHLHNNHQNIKQYQTRKQLYLRSSDENDWYESTSRDQIRDHITHTFQSPYEDRRRELGQRKEIQKSLKRVLIITIIIIKIIKIMRIIVMRIIKRIMRIILIPKA